MLQAALRVRCTELADVATERTAHLLARERRTGSDSRYVGFLTGSFGAAWPWLWPGSRDFPAGAARTPWDCLLMT
ncbi:hypothetical protein ACIQU4_25665 [Streptomyces sp. NPDC090741]|uniref:hypothetical protein n=1 Tax=Streptomyces sp. NPDC090741 TaxID=3365967 RepID=UPI00382F66FF